MNKPTGGIKGRRVQILDTIDYEAGKGRLRTGEIVDLAEHVQSLPRLVTRSGSRGFVVQETVQQHPFLAELNPSTSNTIRLVTHLRRSGDVEIPFAVLRLGRAGSMTDNWSQGGVSVGIDPASGRLSTGLLKPRHDRQVPYSHPDTGVTFFGQVVPLWPEVLALSRGAAQTIPGVRSIGWDMLLTADGPVILEANEARSVVMVQVHTSGWLA